jgi:hypothetical protein
MILLSILLISDGGGGDRASRRPPHYLACFGRLRACARPPAPATGPLPSIPFIYCLSHPSVPFRNILVSSRDAPSKACDICALDLSRRHHQWRQGRRRPAKIRCCPRFGCVVRSVGVVRVPMRPASSGNFPSIDVEKSTRLNDFCCFTYTLLWPRSLALDSAHFSYVTPPPPPPPPPPWTRPLF